MADGDTVKMKLTFWRDGKKPGDLVDVPVDEVHRWKGFAVLVDEPKTSSRASAPTAETAKAK